MSFLILRPLNELRPPTQLLKFIHRSLGIGNDGQEVQLFQHLKQHGKKSASSSVCVYIFLILLLFKESKIYQNKQTKIRHLEIYEKNQTTHLVSSCSLHRSINKSKSLTLDKSSTSREKRLPLPPCRQRRYKISRFKSLPPESFLDLSHPVLL